MFNSAPRRRLMVLAMAGLGLGQPVWAAPDSVGCLVEPHSIARLGAVSQGVIAVLNAGRADLVRKGDILAELEASEEDANVALAQLRLSSDIAIRLAQRRAETAEANAERLTSLADRDLTPRSEQEDAILAAQTARLEEEEALFQREVAQLQLDAARAARERKRIRAPFDGVVTDRLMSLGELYTEQSPVYVIARTDPLHVEAYLPAERRADVRVGQTAYVMLDKGATVPAIVDVIDPVLDAATDTFGLRMTLPNGDGAILAGQSCEVFLRKPS